jgi:hypothetical protein
MISIALLAGSAPGVQAEDACSAQARKLVELMPGISAGTGISNGPQLVRSDTRLLLVSSIFVFSSCQLSTPGKCGRAPELNRERWLETLMYSGLLVDCFEPDGQSYMGQQKTAWNKIQRAMPKNKRARMIGQAVNELGVNLEVSK